MARMFDRKHLSRDEVAPTTQGNLFEPAPGTGSISGGWDGQRRTAMRRIALATSVGALGTFLAIRHVRNG
jgi:hypothetical protein